MHVSNHSYTFVVILQGSIMSELLINASRDMASLGSSCEYKRKIQEELILCLKNSNMKGKLNLYKYMETTYN